MISLIVKIFSFISSITSFLDVKKARTSVVYGTAHVSRIITVCLILLIPFGYIWYNGHKIKRLNDRLIAVNTINKNLMQDLVTIKKSHSLEVETLKSNYEKQAKLDELKKVIKVEKGNDKCLNRNIPSNIASKLHEISKQ